MSTKSYPPHYEQLSDAELRYLGYVRQGSRIVSLSKLSSDQKRSMPKAVPVPMRFTEIEETDAILPTLEELADKHRPQFDFFELANFQDKQMEAFHAVMSHKYTLYGGAAGGGKSYFLRWMALFLCLYYHSKYGSKGVRVGLFCEDYPSLKERQISKVEFEFPPWLGEMNKSESEFRLKPEFGSGVIAFRNLDDPAKYLSSEFASILVDEITRDQKEVFNFLVMRMRWASIPSEDTRFIAASNPGGPGHGWVKGLWIDRDFREYPRLMPDQVAYVKALYTDNKFIDDGYGDQLSMLPDDLAKAYRDGNWDIFAGQYFTEFNRDIHVIPPMRDKETLELFEKLPVWCGLDYGYTNASCVVFGRYWDGVWYIFDEIYVKMKTYEELRALIEEKGYNIELIFADPSLWAKKDSPTSGADRMQPLPMRKALNERIIGWTIMREYFKTNTVKIYNTCTNLIRTIPVMVHHEKNVEDLDTKAEDHAVDAARYLLFSHKQMMGQQDILTYTPRGQQSESDFDELFGHEGQHPALYSMGFVRPRY